MDFDREERERAIQEADRLLADFDRDEWQRSQREKYRRAPSTEIIRDEPRLTQQQPQQRTVMDDATAKSWNDWLTTYVGKALDANNEMMVDATVEFVCEYVHEHLKAEVDKLREGFDARLKQETAKISSLCEELSHLRADVSLGVRAANGKIPGLIHRHNVPVRRGHNGVAHR